MTLYINVQETIRVTDRVGYLSVTRDSDISFTPVYYPLYTFFRIFRYIFGPAPPIHFNSFQLKPIPVGLF